LNRRQILLSAAALGLPAGLPARAAESTSATLEYSSSVDGTKPLLADVVYRADGQQKPLLLVMHGYTGSRKSVATDLRELAARGVVAVAPDLRGRGTSGGRWDSGGLDVHDILDAALAVVRRLPAEIDARNLNVVGYSGGGGNAIGCAVRFPDLFRTCVSFFGISDYGWWYHSDVHPERSRLLEGALGGPPEQVPEKYAARNYNAAAGNVRLAKLHLFWDEEERRCLPGMIEAFTEEHRKAGLANAVVHRSRKTDAVRWIHGYRTDNPHLSEAADSRFLPDVLRAGPSLRLPERGRLVVPGYVVTRRFQVWLGDGQQGRAVVDYRLAGEKIELTVVENPAGHPIRLVRESPLGALP
jgi:pimeloyl-ACP methyl ester carboxylesterase